MKVWTSTDFEGLWPVGTAAVVVAESEVQAREILSLILGERGFPASAFTLTEIELSKPAAYVLRDGDY